MPRPFNEHEVFNKASDLPGNDSVYADSFEGFHEEPSKTLGNDRMYQTYFAQFGLNIMIWGASYYAPVSETFAIPDERYTQIEEDENSRLMPTIECGGAPRKGAFEELLQECTNYGKTKTPGTYLNAIMNMSGHLHSYQPLLKLGAGYMQLKRLGEVNEVAKNSFEVMSLMNILQCAAFDIVSRNLGKAIGYAYISAKPTRYKGKFFSFPKTVDLLLDCKLDLKREASKENMLTAINLLNKELGDEKLGDFFTQLKEKISNTTPDIDGSIDMTRTLQSLIKKYHGSEVSPELEQISKDGYTYRS